MARTRIKICGLTREADVDDAVDAGADALGFVLYAKSPRHVSLARAAELIQRLPPLPQALLQFHGDESPAQCDAADHAYLRAVRMAPGVDLIDCAAQFDTAQGLLLDAHAEVYGGSGKVFDWSLIPPSVPLPVVLSGGLNPANVGDGVIRVRPWAVDVSSGVEISKGVKSGPLMRRFCRAVRDADA
jgi:phosphoribosylanthranilate isomerase